MRDPPTLYNFKESQTVEFNDSKTVVTSIYPNPGPLASDSILGKLTGDGAVPIRRGGNEEPGISRPGNVGDGGVVDPVV
jgi:hypothetical protein